MNIERPHLSRTNGSMTRMVSWTDLPPRQAGLAAALERAFAMPADDRARELEALLRQLA
jgi:hypothetical protein